MSCDERAQVFTKGELAASWSTVAYAEDIIMVSPKHKVLYLAIGAASHEQKHMGGS